jgi:hypothetical protein
MERCKTCYYWRTVELGKILGQSQGETRTFCKNSSPKAYYYQQTHENDKCEGWLKK